MWFIRGSGSLNALHSLTLSFSYRVNAMANASALFNTVASQNHLGFWANQVLDAQKVARFFDLDKREVAKVADVAPASVRYDQKMPREMAQRMAEIANIAELVAQHFDGDGAKTALWFQTKNPLFGGISPRDMIRYGRYAKLQRFVTEALEHSAERAAPGIDRHAATPARAAS